MSDSKEIRSRGRRAGFTLVELLVVSVLGTVVLAAIYQVLVVNQRTYAAQEVRIGHQQGLRTGMLVLTSALREVSAGGNDIVAMSSDSIRYRRMRSFGIVCDADPGVSPVKLTIQKMGAWFEGTDSIFVFADGNPNVANDDVWLAGDISTSVSPNKTCPAPNGNVAQEVHAKFPVTATPTDILTGAPARAYEHDRYTLGLFNIDGEWWMGRRQGSQDALPIAGPLKSRADGGVEFEYVDTLGDATTDPGAVGQILVTLRASSDMRDSRGNMLQDSIRTRVWVRNN